MFDVLEVVEQRRLGIAKDVYVLSGFMKTLIGDLSS